MLLPTFVHFEYKAVEKKQAHLGYQKLVYQMHTWNKTTLRWYNNRAFMSAVGDDTQASLNKVLLVFATLKKRVF